MGLVDVDVVAQFRAIGVRNELRLAEVEFLTADDHKEVGMLVDRDSACSGRCSARVPVVSKVKDERYRERDHSYRKDAKDRHPLLRPEPAIPALFLCHRRVMGCW